MCRERATCVSATGELVYTPAHNLCLVIAGRPASPLGSRSLHSSRQLMLPSVLLTTGLPYSLTQERRQDEMHRWTWSMRVCAYMYLPVSRAMEGSEWKGKVVRRSKWHYRIHQFWWLVVVM
ncbi:hypothetical protein CABS01_09368 [Colletotrichum abscissum]|uniref:uncharacterized protein n=1 Tax=Colletotrichum abscissum TaxID=1671311 RepID=UPI0027D704B4|nr:uncharacterized protein CABS01_09368 [Colletotrichum abscissum]KAK1502757.1 hypothetical protein CABS01_09368 [Colletotrichum abscissum]